MISCISPSEQELAEDPDLRELFVVRSKFDRLLLPSLFPTQ
jgi:hypothetical protein